jgi:hypothetical protein
MAIAEFKEAVILLIRIPALWIPGVIGGFLAATLFVIYNFSGAFYAGRLLILSGLVLLLFTTGMLATIKKNEGNIRTLLEGSSRYYFRVLLPQLIIIFTVILIVTFVMITLSFISASSDFSSITALTLGFLIPLIVLTIFYDTAAIFEDRKVFDSIRRSVQLVMTHLREVITFLFVCAVISIGIIFSLMIVWEAFLYDKLEPITRYNETQLQTFSPDQLITIIGPGGMWITVIILFIGFFLLIPLLFSYKACVFRKLTRETVIIQQETNGEYDSKGRWYKY